MANVAGVDLASAQASSEDAEYPASELLSRSPGRGYRSAANSRYPVVLTFTLAAPAELAPLLEPCKDSDRVSLHRILLMYTVKIFRKVAF